MSHDEKDVSAKQCSPQTYPRISYAHEHDSRARRAQTTAGQGAQTADRTSPSQASASLEKRTVRAAFPKAARLLMRRDFLALQRRGKRQHCAHFVVITTPAAGKRSRLGITVTRRFGNAVIRNRMKRVVREFFRVCQRSIIPARDILVIPRPGAERLTSAQIAEELGKALSLGKRTT
jgi:ribonuclease P protein component